MAVCRGRSLSGRSGAYRSRSGRVSFSDGHSVRSYGRYAFCCTGTVASQQIRQRDRIAFNEIEHRTLRRIACLSATRRRFCGSTIVIWLLVNPLVRIAEYGCMPRTVVIWEKWGVSVKISTTRVYGNTFGMKRKLITVAHPAIRQCICQHLFPSFVFNKKRIARRII